MLAPERDQTPDVFEQRMIDLGPVDPRDLVVLAVRVVVAFLGPAELVSHRQHRHALRKEKRGEQVSLLLRAELEHRWLVGVTFNAAVPRPVVRLAISFTRLITGSCWIMSKKVDRRSTS